MANAINSMLVYPLDISEGQYGVIYLNCTISRSVSYSADIPEYIAEQQDETDTSKYIYKYVSDTIQRKPFNLELTIFESDMPSNLFQLRQGMSGRLQTIKETLVELADNGTVFELITPDDIFDDMVITSITFPEDDYLNGMEISLSLQKIYYTGTSEEEVASTSTEYEYYTDSDTSIVTLEEAVVAYESIKQVSVISYISQYGLQIGMYKYFEEIDTLRQVLKDYWEQNGLSVLSWQIVYHRYKNGLNDE